MRAKPGTIQTKIMEFLESDGPATRAEIREETGIADGVISGTLHRLRDVGLVHISGYVRSLGDGTIKYPRAIYRSGPGMDVQKPKRNQRKTDKESRDIRAARISSVFDLAIPAKQRMAGVRAHLGQRP